MKPTLLERKLVQLLVGQRGTPQLFPLTEELTNEERIRLLDRAQQMISDGVDYTTLVMDVSLVDIVRVLS